MSHELHDAIVEPAIVMQAQIYSHIGFRVQITVALPRYVFNKLALELDASAVLDADNPKIQFWPDITFVPQAEVQVEYRI